MRQVGRTGGQAGWANSLAVTLRLDASIFLFSSKFHCLVDGSVDLTSIVTSTTMICYVFLVLVVDRVYVVIFH